MKRYDAIVLGIGGVGSAALYHLAKRGVRAIGIDQFSPPHDRGSSHGDTRVIRQAYFEHTDYVPLLKEAYRLWDELETLAKQQLFHRVGLIELGPPNGIVVPGVLRAAKEHGLQVESLSAGQVEQRWPGIRAGADLVGVFEPAAGFLKVEECVRSHLDAARAAGAEVMTDTEIQSWTASDGGVRVQTANGDEFVANRLVIAAGAWAGRVLSELNIRLTVLRKSLFWFATDDARYETASHMPVFLFELQEGRSRVSPKLGNGSFGETALHGIFYGFPKIDDKGVKFAEHSGGRPVTDPLVVDRTIDADEQHRLIDFASQHLPGVSSRVTDHAVCLYTMSPDEHFIIDRHPAHDNVVFAAGLSGHGFKFTSVLGRALADLALDGGTELPIDFLSLNRFADVRTPL
jgi:monomeric sarcosine oxidase